MRPGLVGRIALAGTVLVLPGACSDDGGGQDAFCEAAADTDAFESYFEGFDPNDIADAIRRFSEARDVEIRLRRDAPEAVRADVDLLVQYFDDLVEGLEDIDPSSTSRPAVYDEVLPQNDRIEAASKRIQTYIEANCGPVSTEAE